MIKPMQEASPLVLVTSGPDGPILKQVGDLIGLTEIAPFLDRTPSLTKPDLRMGDAKLQAKR